MAVKIGAYIGCGVLAVGVIFLIVGLATPEWVETDVTSATFGLWEVCGNDVCVDVSDQMLNDAFRAVRAMIILAMLAGFGALACVVVHIVMSFLGKEAISVLPIVTIACGIATLVLTIIGVIIFAEDDDVMGNTSGFDYGYSFALTIVGGFLVAAGAVVFFILGKE